MAGGGPFGIGYEYLEETANPDGTMGGTMRAHGMEATLGNLHPEMRRRLEAAIREARSAGIEVGVGSAYRAPGWDVGGYTDKYNSLHSYGGAVDLSGIGRPGSDTARRWYDIATKHGLHNPYGPDHRAEWNHYQIVPQMGRQFVEANPNLRQFVNDQGPVDQNAMWDAVMAYAPETTVPPTQGAYPGTARQEATALPDQSNSSGYLNPVPPSGPAGSSPGQQPMDDDRRRLVAALTPEYVRVGGNEDYSGVTYGYGKRFGNGRPRS